MLITMVVSLYTSRVVLNTLGVNDFGIYNVVGGVVAMFGFITNTMASASQRFLAYEIGRKDEEKLRKTFSVTVTIYLLFAVTIIILAETIGLWFIYNKLNLPAERFIAAIWVYQFSILAFIVSILRIPYNAAIIAHEKMGFYAWNSIVEVCLKLLIVLMLVWLSYDKLMLYSVLTFLVVLIITIIYIVYSNATFTSCKYKFQWDKNLFQTMFNFAGWTLFDSLANIGMNQGVNILLNIFFGPTINAARGIAYQISSQVASFVYGFQMATSPQLVKYYASNQKDKFKKLYYRSSKLSYFLLFFITLPVLFEMDLLLKWWLKNVPDYTTLFARLVLISILIDCCSGTSNDVAKATGKVKYYNMFTGIIMFLNLPVSFLFLQYRFEAQSTMIIAMFFSTIAFFFRLILLRSIIGFSVLEYLNFVVRKILLVSIFATILPLFIYYNIHQNIFALFIIFITCMITTSLSIYFIGIDAYERLTLQEYLKKIKHKYF